MKKIILWCAAAVVLMVGGPWLTVAFAGTNGMAVCFLLFFAANPLFSVFCGIAAGNNIRRRWLLPIFTAVAFLVGVWLFFDMSETAFLLYSGIYLLLGGATMLIRALVVKYNLKTQKNRSEWQRR